MEKKMENRSYTMNVRKPRPAKISAYVHPDRKKYLLDLADANSRKISAQLDLIIKEHFEANKSVSQK